MNRIECHQPQPVYKSPGGTWKMPNSSTIDINGFKGIQYANSEAAFLYLSIVG